MAHYRKAKQNIVEVIPYETSTQDKSEQHELSVVADQIGTIQTQVEGLMNKEQG